MSIVTRRLTATSVAACALLVAGGALISAPTSSAGAAQHTMLIAKAAASKTKTSASAGGAVSYSAAQATTGEKAYGANCSSCHGEKLEGGVGPALTGPTLNTLAKNTKLTVGDMFTFISQQMPLNAPASLSHDQYSAIMAYILKFNGYPAGGKALSYDTAKGSKVVIKSKK